MEKVYDYFKKKASTFPKLVIARVDGYLLKKNLKIVNK